MDNSTAGLGRNGSTAFTYEQPPGISNHGSQDQRVGQVRIALRMQMPTYGDVVSFDRPQSRLITHRGIDRVAGGSGRIRRWTSGRANAASNGKMIKKPSVN